MSQSNDDVSQRDLTCRVVFSTSEKVNRWTHVGSEHTKFLFFLHVGFLG